MAKSTGMPVMLSLCLKKWGCKMENYIQKNSAIHLHNFIASVGDYGPLFQAYIDNQVNIFDLNNNYIEFNLLITNLKNTLKNVGVDCFLKLEFCNIAYQFDEPFQYCDQKCAKIAEIIDCKKSDVYKVVSEHVFEAVKNRVYGIDKYLKAAHEKIARKKGLLYADKKIWSWCQRLKVNKEGISFYAVVDDYEIRDKAKELSESYTKTLLAAKNYHFSERLEKMIQFCENWTEYPYPVITNKDKLEQATETKFKLSMTKPTDALWWRRRLRTKCRRLVETVLREAGFVRSEKGGYCSDRSMNEVSNQRYRNRQVLENTVVENQNEDQYTLAELADKSISNPSIRRGEMMVMFNGLQTLAKERGDCGVFCTLTLPSNYHAFKKIGIKSIGNSEFSGATPLDGQVELRKLWQLVRSELQAEKIRIYGMRVAEPHHDGTPHWHMMLFVDQKHMGILQALFKRFWLRDHPEIMSKINNKENLSEDEQATIRARCDFKEIDESKGCAAAYIAKYISKNIDITGNEEMEDDETGGFCGDSISRVQAWSSVWGIRQFQQIGGAGKTIYRELRKIDEDEMKAGQKFIDVMNEEEVEKLNEVRKTASDGDYAEYTRKQGGVIVKRAEQVVQLFKKVTGKIGKNFEKMMQIFGGVEVVETVKQVIGVFMPNAKEDNYQRSRYYDWEVFQKGQEPNRKESSFFNPVMSAYEKEFYGFGASA